MTYQVYKYRHYKHTFSASISGFQAPETHPTKSPVATRPSQLLRGTMSTELSDRPGSET